MSSPLKQNTATIQELLNTINSLPEAGTDLPELSNEGSASDLLSGKQLIDSDGNIVTGTIATKTASNLTASGDTVTVPAGYYASQATKSVATATQATPSITVDSDGKITASAAQTAGYVTAGTKTATKQLTTQAAKTVTPTKSSQTAVAKDVYTTGVITVAAIPSEYITTTDATASADEIMNGETAYVNGSKVTGTFTIDSELSTQDSLISQIQTALQNKASASEPVLQTKTVTPSTSAQNVTPDSGYDGLSSVTVNAMPTATQATPSITVSSSGLITASATQTAGYVTAGTKSATKQLTTQAAKTITPSTSSQIAVASGVYTTGAITVNAIPSTYVKPTTTKAATTYTPTTSNQTIAAGTYCSGVQTISGDVNLKAENIAEGVSIFGITGTHSGGSGGGSGGGGIKTCTATVKSVYGAIVDVYATAVNENGDVFVFSKRLAQTDSTVTFTAVCSTAMIIMTSTSAVVYSGYGFTEDPSSWDYATKVKLLTTPNAGDAVYLECIDDS